MTRVLTFTNKLIKPEVRALVFDGAEELAEDDAHTNVESTLALLIQIIWRFYSPRPRPDLKGV